MGLFGAAGARRADLLLSTAVAAALAISGCTQSAVSEITGPDPATKCEVTLADLPSSVSSGAARLTPTLSTNRDCPWTIRSEASWLQVRPGSGQGPASLTVDVSENPAAIARSTALVVGDSRVTVTQEAAPCRFELASSSSRVPPEGGAFQVHVSALAGCKWRAASDVSWIRVVSAEASGSGSAEFVAGANTAGERSGTLTIAGLPHLVQQAAATSLPPPSPGPPAPAPPPPSPPPTPPPAPAPLTLVMDPATMPIGYLGERFAGLTVRAKGGKGPYQITGKNILGWPSSLDYKVDASAGTALWHGIVTRTGEFPVRMTVQDSAGARAELLLTFVFR